MLAVEFDGRAVSLQLFDRSAVSFFQLREVTAAVRRMYPVKNTKIPQEKRFRSLLHRVLNILTLLTTVL
jgi:hypothetical protein